MNENPAKDHSPDSHLKAMKGYSVLIHQNIFQESFRFWLRQTPCRASFIGVHNCGPEPRSCADADQTHHAGRHNVAVTGSHPNVDVCSKNEKKPPGHLRAAKAEEPSVSWGRFRARVTNDVARMC